MAETAATLRLPSFRMPPDACDTHCHVVGPRARFPFAPERQSDPTADATEEMLAAMHGRIGVSRAVIVQSGLHGTDPAVTLNAVAAGGGRRRGIVLVEPSIPDQELERLHAGGIRGIRHNLAVHRGDLAEPAPLLRLAERVAGLGWHFLLHMSAAQLIEHADLLRRLAVPILIDHLCRIDPSGGADQPSFRRLLALLATGTVWVKIAAVDKLSQQPYPHRDIAALAAALVRAAPDRVVWGTDWPHPDGRGLRQGLVPDDAALAALIPLYAPDAATQRKLLVDNPARLYGFA